MILLQVSQNFIIISVAPSLFFQLLEYFVQFEKVEIKSVEYHHIFSLRNNIIAIIKNTYIKRMPLHTNFCSVASQFISIVSHFYSLKYLLHQFTLLFFSCRPFLNCGYSAVFMFGYCVYYFFAQSNMSGVLQTSFFFGYMVCVCYGFFIMLGAVGFYSSLPFVRHIYGAIKCE